MQKIFAPDVTFYNIWTSRNGLIVTTLCMMSVVLTWKRKSPAFEQFYANNHHLLIPSNHTEEVNRKKINLGRIGIRTLGCFLQHLDFKQWLDCHDFVYDERRAHFEMDVKPAFKQFYERENHLRIPQNHKEKVNEKEVKLGQIVHNIRKQGRFLQYEDFKKWLDTHNFIYDEHRAHLEEEIWPAFDKFYERENHLRIPQIIQRM